MRPIITLILISLLFSESGNSHSKLTTSTNTSFQSGEKLSYELFFGLINGGQAILSVEEKEFEGTKVMHAIAKAQTTGLANRLFRILNIYESFMNPVTGLPNKAIRNVSEGRYRFYDEVRYDRERNVIISQRNGEKAVPVGIEDMVSGFYNLRRTLAGRKLELNEIIEFTTYFSDEIYPLKFRFKGTEVIRTRMGRFRTLVFAPVTEVGRLFKTDEDILIWVTDDSNFLPLRMKVNMLVGTLKCELIEYYGLKTPLTPLQ